MNDLYLLLSMVLITSIVLFMLRFKLWWLFLIVGVSVYLLLTLMVTKSIKVTTTQIDTIKTKISSYILGSDHKIMDLMR